MYIRHMRTLAHAMVLPVQTRLNHRGVFGNSDAPLFPQAGMFEKIGGREAVARLVDGLYDSIERDSILRQAFNRDLTRERGFLKLFFEEWFGGAPAYFNAEWRLGLHAAHGGVSISRGMAERWLGHFFDSFNSLTTFLLNGVDVNAPAILPGSEASTQGLPMLCISPLCAALAKRRESVVELLVEHGAQYDIFTASFCGDLDAARKLLELAPELVNAHDPACDVASITPLLHAVSTGQLEVSQLLLERGASVGANSVRLVRIAANAGQEALTKLVLAHGADPAMIGAGAWVMCPEISSELLARGANVNHEPGAWIGMCCTGNSGHKENVALIQAMLHCGADVSAQYKGRTALHCAAKAGFPGAVEVLIARGADVNAIDECGQTPLDEIEHATTNKKYESVLRLLFDHGAHRGKQGDA